MLAHALGLPEDRMEHRLNKLGFGDTILIEGAFISDINRMFNSQSGVYNSLVLAKTLQLVDSHLFSFHEIHKARLAFDVYEMNALRSDKNTFELILHTIKACDYRISPIKLRHRLYHYHLNKTRILHLCEYFDLLLMSDRVDKKAELAAKKLIDIANPKSVDQQLIDEMNTKYLDEEQNRFFLEVSAKGKMIENSVWPAKFSWQHQVNDAALQKVELRRRLSASVLALKQSHAGGACKSPGHSSTSKVRQSRPKTTGSTVDLEAPPAMLTIDRSETPTKMTEIELKGLEVANRIQELQARSSFLQYKYTLQREDYMVELFPNGYSKSPASSVESKFHCEEKRTVRVKGFVYYYNKECTERRIKTAKPSIYWTNQSVTK
ncbi:unnamed protein product [Adineta ricciae]|uniref:Uncharacterized protein n=1 Tax=Adineta ricciae TaxID=249248 RepID=A0A816C7E8_ADIRI|nr:unnamed protein product [Adineta ricciae]